MVSDHLIGWSTGALLPIGDKANFPLAVKILSTIPFTCIEFGVLREWELPIFLKHLPNLDISKFERVSFHTCKMKKLTEEELFKQIEPVIELGWPIISHPEMITDCTLWKKLGNRLHIENMDNREGVLGKTIEEMEQIFDKLPDASMCFDIGHARQVDPTMELARDLCVKFAEKIKEIHLSKINPFTCGHHPIDDNALEAFSKITDVLPSCPIILEYRPLTDIEKEAEYIKKQFPKYGMQLKLRG